MSFIRSLAENPNIPGDFTDRDESLRTRQIKIIGHYAITYWVVQWQALQLGSHLISIQLASRCGNQWSHMSQGHD